MDHGPHRRTMQWLATPGHAKPTWMITSSVTHHHGHAESLATFTPTSSARRYAGLPVLYESFRHVTMYESTLTLSDFRYRWGHSSRDEPHHRSAQVRHALSRDHTVLPATHTNYTCVCLPRSWYSFTEHGGMKGWVGLEIWYTAFTLQPAHNHKLTINQWQYSITKLRSEIMPAVHQVNEWFNDLSISECPLRSTYSCFGVLFIPHPPHPSTVQPHESYSGRKSCVQCAERKRRWRASWNFARSGISTGDGGEQHINNSSSSSSRPEWSSVCKLHVNVAVTSH